MSPQIFPATQRWKNFAPVWNIKTNFSSFPKMENFPQYGIILIGKSF